MLIIKTFILVILVIVMIDNIPLQSAHDLEDLDRVLISELKITIKNKNYSNPPRLGVFMRGCETLNEAFTNNVLYMLIPEKGQSLSQLYTGGYEYLELTLTKYGIPCYCIKEESKQMFPHYTKHIMISFFRDNNSYFSFPNYNIRYIDNEGFVESLKLLATRAVRKYRDHQINREEIKRKLPLDLQEYLEQNG